MTTDIFIRTYSGDIRWLSYCLKSIHKFGAGFRDVIVTIPQDQVKILQHLTKEKVYTSPLYHDDYIGQQITKLRACEYTDADFILYVDSDCVFTEPFSPEDYIRDGKPVIVRENYERLKEHNDAYARKHITGTYLGFEVEFEYMRRHPFIYHRDDVKKTGEQIGKLEKSSSDRLMTPHLTGMSEFNILGAFCERYSKDKYVFLEVGKDEIPYGKVKQFRSWDGLTKDIEKQIEECLR